MKNNCMESLHFIKPGINGITSYIIINFLRRKERKKYEGSYRTTKQEH